jgi:hypothetical protein
MASYIELDITELNAFSDRVHRAGDTVVKISINEGLRKIGRLIVPAKGTGPLANETPKVTGKLRLSTIFQIVGGPRAQILTIRQGARSVLGVVYGYIVREGRGPVVAKNVKALHFFIGDAEFFRKSVGAAAPNPYHRRVLTRLMPQIKGVVNDMGEKIGLYISGQGGG